MTFTQYCVSQYLYKNDRLLFQKWLGLRATGDRSKGEWHELFIRFMRHLLKENNQK